ncbi:MAG: hypothetical protein ACREJB_18075 [Planctomycetaceae bacterium]
MALSARRAAGATAVFLLVLIAPLSGAAAERLWVDHSRRLIDTGAAAGLPPAIFDPSRLISLTESARDADTPEWIRRTDFLVRPPDQHSTRTDQEVRPTNSVSLTLTEYNAPPSTDALFTGDAQPRFLVLSQSDAFHVTSVGRWLPNELFRVAGGRLRGEYSDVLDEFDRARAHLLVISHARLGIDTEANFRREPLPRGRRDEFWHGDLNLIYAFGDQKRLQFRAGGGANWRHDDGDTKLGYNATYAADLFIKLPWLISAEFDLGKLSDEDLFHGRVTGGFVLQRIEVYLGYDYSKIGQDRTDGLVVGGGLWF